MYSRIPRRHKRLAHRSAMPQQHRFEARLRWTGAQRGPTSSYDAYDRALRVEFDGKPALDLSAAPPFRGDGAIHNPEDLLVAALSACHALSYLALCARRGVRVLAYEDEAVGVMGHGAPGKTLHFHEVVLRPRVTIDATSDRALAERLHAKARGECFIAASVNFPVRHEAEVTSA
jgi:organic hydroperoxide reductase OsmC/OhrA